LQRIFGLCTDGVADLWKIIVWVYLIVSRWGWSFTQSVRFEINSAAKAKTRRFRYLVVNCSLSGAATEEKSAYPVAA
jgi:hypothetical protein